MITPDKTNVELNETPKKRVLFVITQSEFGGAQKFLIDLAKYLDKSKFELSVAVGKDGNLEIEDQIKKTGASFHVLKHARRNISPIHDTLVLFELRDLIKKLRPDTLFLNSSKTTVWGPMAVYFPAKLKHAPRIIYRIGGWSFNDPQPVIFKWLWILTEKIFAGYKDKIIVNNRHDLEQAARLGIEPCHGLELIYNGIDPYKVALLDKDEARIRLYEKLPANQKHANFLSADLIIGTIANFYRTKGLKYLVDSIKILDAEHPTPNTIFVIIGDGPERKNIEYQISNMGLGNRVVLAGRLPDASKYLPTFDIFVLSSVKEGFPWALLEAMSAKLPAITTSVGAVPEVIENKKNGLLIPPRDPQAIADSVSQLAGDESLRRELGIQAHQTVLHKFSFNKMIDQIEELL